MIKAILCIAIIVLCGAVGFGVSGYYTQRKKFFFDLLNFLNSLKTDICFSAKDLKKILYECMNQVGINKDFKLLLKNYTNLLDNNVEVIKENLFKDIKILAEQEKESIYQFFCKLGKLDSFTQSEEIEKLLKINDLYFLDAKDESIKYSSLYIKLGVIIGAFIALIII